jgi:hypothetical protein
MTYLFYGETDSWSISADVVYLFEQPGAVLQCELLREIGQ